jgi:hypothetical protein
MFQKQIVVTAKAVANHSKRSLHCSVGIASKHGSIPGLGYQTAFYSMLTVRMLPVDKVAGALRLPLTAVYCYTATPSTYPHDVGRFTVPRYSNCLLPDTHYFTVHRYSNCLLPDTRYFTVHRYSNCLLSDTRYFKPAHSSAHDCFVPAGSRQGSLISIHRQLGRGTHQSIPRFCRQWLI